METSTHHVPKNHKLLTVIALTEQLPTTLRLRDHGISLSDTTVAGTWSGHFGLNSQHEAQIRSCAEASASGHQSFQLLALCPVGDLNPSLKGKLHTPASVAQTGFLHIGLTQKDFAKEIHAMLLKRLAHELPHSAISGAEKQSLKRLMSTHTLSALWILEAYPAVALLVHPMLTAAGDTWIGTVRQQTAKTMKAEVRYQEHEITAAY